MEPQGQIVAPPQVGQVAEDVVSSVAHVPTTPPIVELPKKTRRKYLLMVVAVVLVLVLLASGIGAYFLMKGQEEASPTPEPTVEPTASPVASDYEGWERYDDQTLGVSFSYPQGWFLYPAATEGATQTTILSNFDLENGDQTESLLTPGLIKVDISKSSTQLGNDPDVVAWIRNNLLNPSADLITGGEIDFAGKTAVRVDYDLSGERKIGVYYQMGQELLFVGGRMNSEKEAFLFDQILSSFEFVENTESGSTCTLSLCDCKCYLAGETREETEGVMCGINCASEYGVSGCELVDGVCSAI